MERAEEWKLPWEGGCRCGTLRFRIDLPPMLASACHCRGCQRMSGSAFSTTLTIPTAGFQITGGEAVIGGAHGAEVHHHHCGYCKGWVYTTAEPDMGFVNVRATLLDDPSWFVPYLEVYTSERLAWATTPAERSFAKAPRMEEYTALIAEFAERGQRP